MTNAEGRGGGIRIELIIGILIVYGVFILLSISNKTLSKAIWMPFFIGLILLDKYSFKTNLHVKRRRAGNMVEKKGESLWTKFAVGGLTFLGVLSLISTIFGPIFIKRYYETKTENYSTIADLSGIGDYIGGTTVAFLTAASVFLLLATIIMQRTEIKISQEGINQLVEQTKASIQQANDARKEVEITNKTMKHQQFESTFFNMVNLHHNILNDIKLDELRGREVIEKLHGELKEIYQSEIYETAKKREIDNLVNRGINTLNQVVRTLFLDYQAKSYIGVYDDQYIPNIDEQGNSDFSDYDRYIETVLNETDNNWLAKKDDELIEFKRLLEDNKMKSEEFLSMVNFKIYISENGLSNNTIQEVKNNVACRKFLCEFQNNYYNNPLKEYKIEAYEFLYEKHENIFGHYYRNLYRIVKLIERGEFYDDEIKNEKEKQNYRGILRAQLSSFELLMLFYNVAYSKKGKKFAVLITNKKFFDDHLIEKDFLWKNDKEELMNIESIRK